MSKITFTTGHVIRFNWWSSWKPNAALRPILRILIPNGWVVLVWNLPRNPGSPFATAFEQFWHKHIDPHMFFNSERKRPTFITQFFGAENIQEKGLDNFQVCDFEVLRGRVLSSSNSPQPDNPLYPKMLDELKGIFDQHQENGRVTLEYDTKVVYGQLRER